MHLVGQPQALRAGSNTRTHLRVRASINNEDGGKVLEISVVADPAAPRGVFWPIC
jgi:hypothetical protein